MDFTTTSIAPPATPATDALASALGVTQTEPSAETGNLLDVALRYAAAGRAVVPIAPGSKIPSFFNEVAGEFQPLSWSRFQRRPPDPGMLKSLFDYSPLGIGIICGPVSGVQIDGVQQALEVLDVDDEEILDEFVEAARWQGLDELLARLLHERTPRGGGHLAYCCREIAGNTKLAQRQKGVDERGNPIVSTMIETRGAGGQVVVAPTPPGIHPEHPERGYKLVRGSWEHLPVITPEERQALWELGRSFNRHYRR